MHSYLYARKYWDFDNDDNQSNLRSKSGTFIPSNVSVRQVRCADMFVVQRQTNVLFVYHRNGMKVRRIRKNCYQGK